jgi:hypothetical protein
VGGRTAGVGRVWRRKERELISEHFDPEQFVRAIVGWDRLRLEGELERELHEVELICGKAWINRQQPPAACRAYLTFLVRLRDWLGTGVAPRHSRRETRALMHTVGQSLAARGQIDEALLKTVQPRPPRRRNR